MRALLRVMRGPSRRRHTDVCCEEPLLFLPLTQGELWQHHTSYSYLPLKEEKGEERSGGNNHLLEWLLLRILASSRRVAAAITEGALAALVERAAA